MSKVFGLVWLVFLGGFQASAQEVLYIKLKSAADSTAIVGAQWMTFGKTKSISSDSTGYLSIPSEFPKGHIHIYHPEFRPLRLEWDRRNEWNGKTMYLIRRETFLDEVTIVDQGAENQMGHMKAIQGVGIYEAKKSDVIRPEFLVANLATNNARQVYARVAGLNIWENDGSGLQLNIGGRGLDPNRSSNFNVRQNGYDISADALGYPESYYTPPTEGLGKIQVIRGAASLQYGTQFGGLINFEMKRPPENKKWEVLARQSVGSYGFYNSFASIGGTIKKLSYYSFFQYKRGNGWRQNAGFESHTYYGYVGYQATEKLKIGLDVTQMDYLAQQPGGLTDAMFANDPRQSNRDRNWFKVNWNLLALHLDYKFSPKSDLNLRLFGLLASRYSVGFRPNRVATFDDNSYRDLIKGDFVNWGMEARWLTKQKIVGKNNALLIGGRYYQGFNHNYQGLGSTSKGADFEYVNSQWITYDYRFPSRNVSLFLEDVFFISDKLSVTPGGRFEYIDTQSAGYYGTIFRDLANNIIDITQTNETQRNTRSFILAGIGASFKPIRQIDVYANISQNYRSITFSDIRINNPSMVIDPNLKDEKGYSFDIGFRSHDTRWINFDFSYFLLNYDNRIGEVQFYNSLNQVLRKRSNIGQAIIQGLECYAETDVLRKTGWLKKHWSGVIFANMAFIQSRYVKSAITNVEGKQVEYVPDVNTKAGLRFGFKSIKLSIQNTYLSQQYSDATNAVEGGVSAVVGIVPAYSIWDLGLSWEYKWLKLEGNINNLTDAMYFTRRATGYPGPGILPSDGRTFYFTLQVKI